MKQIWQFKNDVDPDSRSMKPKDMEKLPEMVTILRSRAARLRAVSDATVLQIAK